MKKFLSLFVAVITIFYTFLNSFVLSYASNDSLSIPAEAAVLMDYETGEVLYSKNGNEKIYPASTTKAWTAYLVLKYKPNLNEPIKIDKELNIEGSSMYLKLGEEFTVKELLESLLVHSSNDVAVVLAEYVSGSVSEFVKLMNSEAKSIGANNTHFNNPNGLPDKDHYTTAHDMALIARECMSNNTFRQIVKTKSISFPATEAYPYERYFINTNKFLTSKEKINYKGKDIDIKYDIVDGIKTGYTDDAGRCLLSSAVKNDMRMICAVFKSTGNDIYLASRTLLDYGFNNYHNKTIISKNKYTFTERILFTKQKELTYEPEFTYKVLLKNGSSTDNYSTKVKLDKIKLPIKKGDKVGTLEVYNGRKLETTINLISTNNLNSILGPIIENKIVSTIIKLILFIFIVLFIGLLYLKVINKKRKRLRKRRK